MIYVETRHCCVPLQIAGEFQYLQVILMSLMILHLLQQQQLRTQTATTLVQQQLKNRARAYLANGLQTKRSQELFNGSR